jgi:hypothetical protein
MSEEMDASHGGAHVILAFRRLRWEDLEFETRMGNIDPILKNKKEEHEYKDNKNNNACEQY